MRMNGRADLWWWWSRYWAYKNAWSMDGLPGMQRGLHTAVTDKVKPIKKMVGPCAALANGKYKPSQRVFVLRHLLLTAVLSAVSTVVLMFFLLRLVGVDIDINEVLKH